MTYQNPECDGSGPCSAPTQRTRKLPLGGDANLILCRACFEREIDYRRDRNRTLEAFAKFKLPAWEDLRSPQTPRPSRPRLPSGRVGIA